MGTREILHLLAAAHFWFGCFYDWNFVILPMEKNEMNSYWLAGKLKYLTYWDALLQGLFYTVCFINDLIGTNEPHPKKTPLIRKFRDTLLCGIAFPLAMFVAVTFWGLYFIDRELILPKAMDPFFPGWLNHIMHTNIAIFLLIEMVTSFRRYPSRKQGISLLAFVTVSYLIWVHVIHNYTGKWVYPILEVLNFQARILFFVGMAGFMAVLYIVGEKLNNLVWSKELKYVKAKKAY